jgi:hypothetical protein
MLSTTVLFCFSNKGDAMDNVGMYPQSGQLEGMKDTGKIAGSDYFEWLLSDTCEPRKVVVPFVTPDRGLSYIDSVPEENRKPHRWGWKNPKVMYHLEVLLTMYPDLIYIQVVRNPYDMASYQFEHLHNRVKEFVMLHGGYEDATALSNIRCLKVAPDNPKSCLLSVSALKNVADCQKSNIEDCVRQSDVSTRPPWQCMDMQLWAQINSASYVFGVRCLNSLNRFLVWHGEDVYGNRGAEAQLQLQKRIAGIIHLLLFCM